MSYPILIINKYKIKIKIFIHIFFIDKVHKYTDHLIDHFKNKLINIYILYIRI